MADAADWAKQAKTARAGGDHQEALRCYLEAMGAARIDGDRQAQIHHGRHAADLYRKLGKYDEAHVLISVTLGFYRESPPDDLELANTLRMAALVDSKYEENGKTAELWREARDLYAKLGIQVGVDEQSASWHG